MIRKERSFCNQNCKFVASLSKKLKIVIFILFIFNRSFFQSIFDCNIPFGRVFPTIPNLLSFVMVQKISAMNKLVKRTLDRKSANGAQITFLKVI